MHILMLGHSLIEFFDWEGRFPTQTVYNLGIAGETVEGLLGRLDHIIKRYPKADLIFIMTGTNNIAMEDFNFVEPYREILVKLANAYPEAKIFIHSVLPIILEWIEKGSVETVNSAIERLAQEQQVGFVDMHTCFVHNGEPIREYLLDDGVHLSGKGYEVWSRVIEGIIEERG